MGLFDADMEDRESRRLHFELEQAIKTINHEQIGSVTGNISKQAFNDCVRMVACLRARYLQTVLRLGQQCRDSCIETESALELKALREAYVEAVEGFNALEHALQRGYIELVK